MTEGKWEVVTTVSGSMQADILRTLLESRDIEVFLNQEGAGRVYAEAGARRSVRVRRRSDPCHGTARE